MSQRIGVRTRLFLTSVGIVFIVVLASGWVLELQLRQFMEGELKTRLLRQARSARVSLSALPVDAPVSVVDPLADRLGEAAEARVTLLDRNGRVIGDSELSIDEVRAVENHGQRPEVQAVRQGAPASSRRYSTTTNIDTLYVAVRGAGPAAVVRVAMPLSLVKQAVNRLRLWLVLAVAVGLVFSVLMSLLSAHLMARTLRALVEQARLVAHGQSKRVEVSSEDEVGTLGQSFNRLAAELRETVATLVRERDQQSTVLQSMREGVLTLNEEGAVETANHAAMTLLGLSRSPVGSSLVEVVRIPTLLELAERAREGDAELEIHVSGDERRILHGAGSPLKRSSGVVLVLHDVTQERSVEAMRRDLVANVSHELRTPVSIIRANSETLLAGALEKPDRAAKFVQAIERNSIRLSSLIDDLLDLARIEAGRYQVEAEDLHPHELVEDLHVSFGQRAVSRNVTVDNELPEDLTVWADRQALEQVLLNLIDNAIKYTHEDGHVVVRAVPEADAVRFEVRDNGPGIPEQHRERIFERFYRIDPGRSRELGGTGLGLSIVKNLVGLMGGTVGADSNDPTGACLWFTVPTRKEVA